MALPRFDIDKVKVIGKLGTTPQERGLTTQQFKDKFDEGPTNLGEFLNEELIPDIEALVPETLMTTDQDQTMTAKLTAYSNTYYTTRQVRNIILSSEAADIDQMENGDIWLQYEEGEE